jgi:hypothetical protein
LNVPERIEWLGDHLQQIGDCVPVALDGGEVIGQRPTVDAPQMPAA